MKLEGICLKPEYEILERWGHKVDPQETTKRAPKIIPKVSIICQAYNHADYIEQTLKGMLMQKTDFAFEIIISDDASTDQTAAIIREYEQRYPHIIKPLYQTENQYQKDILINPRINFKRALGDYIAFCEGDDYWIHTDKLQRQVTALDKKTNYHLSFHSALRINMADNQSTEIIGRYQTHNGAISCERIIERAHGMIPTASCIFRRQVLKALVKYYDENPYIVGGDIYFQYLAAFDQGALYFDEPMSVYRFQAPSSWTHKFSQTFKFKKNFFLYAIRSNLYMNQEFEGKFFSIFQDLNTDHILRLALSMQQNGLDSTALIQPLLSEIEHHCSVHHISSIVLYAASSLTAFFMEHLLGLKVAYILDADLNKHGTTFKQHPVFHPSQLENLKKYPIFIPFWDKRNSLTRQLIEEYSLSNQDFIHISLHQSDYGEMLDNTLLLIDS